MAIEPGQQLLHYRLIEKIGEGGMGEVYLARDTKLNRSVALKILPESVAGDPERRSRFEREAQAIAALNHPNIVTIHSVEQAGDVHFITMELVEGMPLSRLIPKNGLPLSRWFEIAIPLADALGKAHQKGITHRDVKPDNVMLDDEGRIKVLDFGLAKLESAPPGDAESTQLPTATVTAAGRILGTVSYMSPEQAEGRPVDARSDVFSLGVVLYEMATGVRPFRGDTPVSTITSILRDEPPSITELNDRLPRHLDRIVRRCLTKDRNRRYATATDVRNELEAFREEASPGESEPSPRRSVAKIVMGGLAVLAIVVLSVLGIRRLDDGTPPAPAFETKRAVVVEFANRTGDPRLDWMGMLAADTLTDGLTSLRLVEVMPTHALDGLDGDEPERQVALRTGAGAVVSGAFYLEGEGLRFKCNVVDSATGKVAYAVKRATASRTEPAQAIDEIRERLMGLFAMSFHSHRSSLGEMRPHGRLWTLSRPPRYPAFQEFAAALQLHGRDSEAELAHLRRAAELDPDFFEVAFLQIAVLDTRGETEQAEEILRTWERRRDELSDYEKCWLDWCRADLDRNQAEALRQMQLADHLNPADSRITYHIGMHAFWLNRPRLTVTTYEKLGPDGMYDHRWRAWLLAAAHHLLGEYENELEVANRAREKFPGEIGPLTGQARALAALGRIEDLERLLQRSESFSGSGSPGSLMRTAALELRAHGFRDAAARVAERAVNWHERRPAGTSRADLAAALYVAGRWEEARPLYERLSGEHPGHLAYLSALGTIAARSGDPGGARSYADRLERLDEPEGAGESAYHRACITAQLGDKEEAVALLRESFARGRKFSADVHRDPDLEPLRGYPPFEDLLRPEE